MMYSNMMNSIGAGGFWWGVQGLFCWIALIGIILGIAWAIKKLTPAQLLNTAVTLLVIGLVGWLLTAGLGGGYSRYGYDKGGAPGMRGFGQGMMMGGMMECVRDKDCFDSMNQMMNRMNQRQNENNSGN